MTTSKIKVLWSLRGRVLLGIPSDWDTDGISADDVDTLFARTDADIEEDNDGYEVDDWEVVNLCDACGHEADQHNLPTGCEHYVHKGDGIYGSCGCRGDAPTAPTTSGNVVSPPQVALWVSYESHNTLIHLPDGEVLTVYPDGTVLDAMKRAVAVRPYG